MILETALLRAKPGERDALLAALPEGLALLEGAEGFVSAQVLTGIEESDSVLIHLTWQTLEDHTVKFRGGPLFPQWRAVVMPHLAEPPVATHWNL